jgi:proteic killer suppression protein
MEVRFEDPDLDRLETDVRFDGGCQAGIVTKFRMRMQMIRSAPDERDFRALSSLHFEKLKGGRAGEFSMRLNKQWRLILRFDGKGKDKIAVIVGIEDYH